MRWQLDDITLILRVSFVATPESCDGSARTRLSLPCGALVGVRRRRRRRRCIIIIIFTAETIGKQKKVNQL